MIGAAGVDLRILIAREGQVFDSGSAPWRSQYHVMSPSTLLEVEPGCWSWGFVAQETVVQAKLVHLANLIRHAPSPTVAGLITTSGKRYALLLVDSQKTHSVDAMIPWFFDLDPRVGSS